MSLDLVLHYFHYLLVCFFTYTYHCKNPTFSHLKTTTYWPSLRHYVQCKHEKYRFSTMSNCYNSKRLITNVRVVLFRPRAIYNYDTNKITIMVSLQKPDLFEPEVRPSSAQQPLNVRETRAHTTSIKLSNKRWPSA